MVIERKGTIRLQEYRNVGMVSLGNLLAIQGFFNDLLKVAFRFVLHFRRRTLNWRVLNLNFRLSDIY